MFRISDRITLRPLRLTDAPAYYACARKNLARLRPWFYWATDDMELAETQQYLIDVEAQPEPPLDRPYGFFDGETFAGTIGIYKIDFANRIARIGYWIDGDYEGQGLVTAGTRALVDRAFSDLGLNRIEIRCAPGNAASSAVPKRLGFTEEGLHRQVLAIHGGYQDLTMYAMLARDWPAPDNTAVRVALWRAMHAQIDPPPHVLEDEVGLQLAAPVDNWLERPDMNPDWTRPFRASIVARARFIEDLVVENAARGVNQYVILGAGLDTFVQRRPEIGSRMTVYEVDRWGAQAWKRQRLIDLGYGVPEWLRFVPVNFEVDALWDRLAAAGFDAHRPAIVSSTGVSMYLTKDAVYATLRDVASLPPGSTLALTFLLPIELTDPEVRTGFEMAAKGARASGTPFRSYFTPGEMLALARDAGFRYVEHVPAATLAKRYFAGRTDGLRPPGNAEELLVAST